MEDLSAKQKLFKAQLALRLAEAIHLAGGRLNLAKHLGVRYQTLLSWLRGAHPTEENLARIDQFILTNGGQKNG